MPPRDLYGAEVSWGWEGALQGAPAPASQTKVLSPVIPLGAPPAPLSPRGGRTKDQGGKTIPKNGMGGGIALEKQPVWDRGPKPLLKGFSFVH